MPGPVFEREYILLLLKQYVATDRNGTQLSSKLARHHRPALNLATEYREITQKAIKIFRAFGVFLGYLHDTN